MHKRFPSVSRDTIGHSGATGTLGLADIESGIARFRTSAGVSTPRTRRRMPCTWRPSLLPTPDPLAEAESFYRRRTNSTKCLNLWSFRPWVSRPIPCDWVLRGALRSCRSALGGISEKGKEEQGSSTRQCVRERIKLVDSPPVRSSASAGSRGFVKCVKQGTQNPACIVQLPLCCARAPEKLAPVVVGGCDDVGKDPPPPCCQCDKRGRLSRGSSSRSASASSTSSSTTRCTPCRLRPRRRAVAATVRGDSLRALITCQRATL